MSHTKLLLLAVLFFAFIVRVLGIHYGLPLMLVSDEPPFTLAALKMIDLRTLLPVLHNNDFRNILYFPPYLAYAYLLPFVAFLAAKYAMFHGALGDFKNYIVSDLTPFFLIARFINVLLGTATVWLLYRLGKRFFESEVAGLAAASLLATSLLHTALSSVGRDWVPAVFVFTLGIFIVTNPDRTARFRYLFGAAISGIAFGVSLVGGFIMIFILLWYLFAEHHTVKDVFAERKLYGALGIFLALAALAIALHPGGFHFANDNSIRETKSLIGLISYPILFFSPMLYSEPLFLGFALFGLIGMYKRRRAIFWIIFLFSIIYLLIFYFMYHFEHRFTIYLFPLFALAGGAGFAYVFRKIKWRALKISFALLLLVPALAPVKLVTLTMYDDSRTRALRYINSSFPEKTRLATYARLFAVPPTKDAVEEQIKIDPVSVRQTLIAQSNTLSPLKRYHALNLGTITDARWFTTAPQYLRAHNYQYLILDPRYALSDDMTSPFQNRAHSKIIATFAGGNPLYSLTESDFGNIIGFFSLRALGPDIEIREFAL